MPVAREIGNEVVTQLVQLSCSGHVGTHTTGEL